MQRKKIEIVDGKANVSIIITCKDLEKYLEETIESIKQQTVQPREIIVIHDGCEKPTMWDQTQTLFRQENLGVALSRHQGVLLSSQPYILFIDADDVIPEIFIEMMVRTLEKRGVDIAYPDSVIWVRWGDGKKQNGFYSVPEKITFKNMLRNNWVVVSSLMSRNVYDTIGGFDPSLEVLEDWVFWLEALRHGFKFRKAPTYLKYRQRTQGRNRQPEETKAKIRQMVKIKYTKTANNES